MKQIELNLSVKEKSKLLDFLYNNISNKSKNNIKSLLTNGNVSINSKVSTKYDYELNKNDIVNVKLSQIGKIGSKNRLNILYEDSYLIIVDKPVNLLTIGTEKEKKRTLFHYVIEYIKKDNRNNKVFIVNRLDYDTSGIVVLAKDEKTKSLMQKNWNNDVIRKYIAVVNGITNEYGTIESYLKENKEHYVYSTKDKQDKLAITKYKRIKYNDFYSLLEIDIKTGRKNQIRVHMNDINHPIIGDTKYGKVQNPLKRLLLHAYQISFIHPITKKKINIKTNIPEAFNKLICKSTNKS